MSRRQRRKSGVTSKSRSRKPIKNNKSRKGLWWKTLLGLAVVFLATGVIGYYKAKAYLHSEEFRKLVSKQVSDELGSTGSFSEFTWDGLSGSTSQYKAEGEGAIQVLDVEGISLDVDLNFIKRDVFKLKNVEIAKINSTIDLNNKFLRFEREKPERGFWESMLPEEVELYDAKVLNLNTEIITSGSNYGVEGVAASIERNEKGKGYDIQATGGKFKVPLSIVESAYLKEAKLKLRGNEIYLNSSEFSVHGSGMLELNGFVDLAEVSSKRYELEGKLSSLRCKDVFPADWQKNLKGEVVATFSVAPHLGGLPLIKGHIDIKDGRLEALPVLNKIAYYLADPVYRTIKFQRFACDFEKYEDKVILRNVVLSSRGVLKVEGDIVFDGNKIEGLFNVGLPPAKLSNIPGAETIVFKPGKERMNWTEVRIWGTIDDVEQDLSDRLIAAAGQRIIEEAFKIGGEVIKPEQVEQAAGLVEKGIGEGLKVLQGDKTLLEGLNGLMGNEQRGQRRPGQKQEEEPEKAEPKKEKEKEKKSGILPIPIPVDPRKIPDIFPL